MHTIAIAVTNRCPLKCNYCCIPTKHGDMDENVAIQIVNQVIETDAFSFVGFTGGEPLLRPELIALLGSKLSSCGINWGLTTGAGWATTKNKVDIISYMLYKSNISNITVSIDYEHLKGQEKNIIKYFIEKLIELNIPTILSCTSNDYLNIFPFSVKESPLVKIEYHYVSPVGHVGDIAEKNITGVFFSKSYCPMANSISLSVWPNGNVYPCCSTYIVAKKNQLIIGNIYRSNLKTLLSNALKDIYICAIREIGFHGISYLVPEFSFWSEIFKEPLKDTCHLCYKLSAKRNAIPELREKLLRII